MVIRMQVCKCCEHAIDMLWSCYVRSRHGTDDRAWYRRHAVYVQGGYGHAHAMYVQGFDEGVFGGHFHTANAPPVFGIPGLDVLCAAIDMLIDML